VLEGWGRGGGGGGVRFMRTVSAMSSALWPVRM
jgi:hypothetical protein